MSLRARAGWRWSQARHWLKSRMGTPAAILMYHRVTELANDPHLLAVTPVHFGQHLEAIRAIGAPLRLEELVRALEQGRVPRRAVAVTFDDGYADNLHNAKPLLARHDVPATVYVTAGQVGGRREFWWDELDRLLLQPGTLPPVLRLALDGGVREWRLDEAHGYTEQDRQRQSDWHLECREDPGPRQRLFRALFEILYPLPTDGKWRLLEEVAAWASAPATARPSRPQPHGRRAGSTGGGRIGGHRGPHHDASGAGYAAAGGSTEGDPGEQDLSRGHAGTAGGELRLSPRVEHPGGGREHRPGRIHQRLLQPGGGRVPGRRPISPPAPGRP